MLAFRVERAREARCFSGAMTSFFSRGFALEVVDNAEPGRAGSAAGVVKEESIPDSRLDIGLNSGVVSVTPRTASLRLICQGVKLRAPMNLN
jgi:hypothetical protein